MQNPLLFLLIIVMVIGSPVAVIWLCRQHHLSRGRDAIHQLPQEMRELLKAPEYCRFAEYHEKRAYCIRALLQGTGLYLLVLCVGIIRHLLGFGRSDLLVFMQMSLVLVPFILFFVIRDILRAAPWARVWCIPACKCPRASFEKNEEMVCFYDFLHEEFRTEFVHTPVFSKSCAADEMFEVLAVQRGERLRVFHIVQRTAQKQSQFPFPPNMM